MPPRTARAAARSAATPSPPTAGRARPAPAVPLDPWAWAVALSIVPVLFAARGTPLGSPFADDFDFLHFSLLRGNPSWLDGGGGGLYWRPLARQLYYGVLGSALLTHPGWVAALHVVLLVAGALLVYTALRSSLGRPASAFAAALPLLAESARMIVAWPSCAQDLGAYVFAALAIRQAARGQGLIALVAVAGALLCKEIALAAALMLPFVPGLGDRTRRIRFALGVGALLSAWWAVHAFVARSAAQLPIAAVAPPEAQTHPTLLRAVWASGRAARDAFGAGLVPDATAGALLGATGLALALALAAAWGSRGARARLLARWPWVAWGLAYFVIASAPLGGLYPAWAGYRSLVPAAGLGIALAALASAAHPAWLAPLLAIRLVGLALSPGAPARVAIAADDLGAAFDFPRLARLQRFVVETRSTLLGALPRLPRGARIGKQAWPRMTEYAFAQGKAFQVWYRDSTLRWVRFGDFERDPDQPLAAMLQYQPHRLPQVTLVDVDAMRALVQASHALAEHRIADVLAWTARADSLDHDPRNALFSASVASKRADALIALGRWDEAEREARRALALYPLDQDARVLIAETLLERGDVRGAAEQLAEHLRGYPSDAMARRLWDERIRPHLATPP